MLLALGLLVVGTGYVITGTDSGRSAVRGWVEGRIASSIHGRVHLGRLSGNFLTGLTLDSLELRDDEDSLVVATGRIAVQYDPRDLVDRRIFLRRVDVDHPVVVLRQHEDWTWNFKRTFGIAKKPAPVRRGPERGFGDFVIMDSVHVRHGASLRVTIPWHADDSLSGARRDSAVRANLARRDHEIRRTREGFTQNYRWTNAYAFASHIRLAEPDSVGMLFVVDTVRAEGSYPPFSWRHAQGVARVLGDSAWIDSSRFRLPGSHGRARGKVVWGSDLPVRYAVHIIGDSISLKDVAWVYPTLPTTGGGRLVMDIRNERNLHVLDYAISEMDVSTTRSRVRGAMTFEIGGPVLAVHDVAITADPVNFDLLRTINGRPFPADWQGTLSGTVKARGGPVTQFFVDASDITFRDAHVPGAVSHLRGRGELNILYPAFTAFHDFHVETDRLELRTLSAIYPAFPRIGGTVSGRATLDSSWLDVRVSNADLRHVDGDGPPSRATGGGRITYGTQYVAYDLTLLAQPISFTTLARSYAALPLRGTFTGPVRVRGVAPDLELSADLTGAAGHVTYAGRIDADSVGGLGAKGSGVFDGLDAAALVGRSSPTSTLAGSYDVNLQGDSVVNLLGTLGLHLQPGTIDGIRLTSADARVEFDRGVLRIDTLVARGTPGLLRARGTLGLTRSPGSDSLQLAIDVDSLGGLRPYLARAASAGVRGLSPDSLGGTLRFRGVAHGFFDSLDVRGTLRGDGLLARGGRVSALTGALDLQRRASGLTGTLSLRGDTVTLGGLTLANLSAGADIYSGEHARFSLATHDRHDGVLRVGGDWRASGDSTAIIIDTLALDASGAHWRLGVPSRLASSPRGVFVDTLDVRDANGARIAGIVSVPEEGRAHIRLQGDSIGLAQFGSLAQLPLALAGALTFHVEVSGDRAQPVIQWRALADSVTYGTLATEAVRFAGGYADARATATANVIRGGRSALDASLSYPLALSLFSARTTEDSLRGRIHADSVDLSLIEALLPRLQNSSGRLALDLAISGRPEHPHVGGTVGVQGGAVEVPAYGIRFGAINAAMRVDPRTDSLTIERIDWISPANGGTAHVDGTVVFRDLTSPQLDVRLSTRGLRAVDRRGLARLDVSTGTSGIQLTGTPQSAALSGAVQVDRGTIYIPDLIRKQVEQLSPEDFALLYDTTDVQNRSLMPQPPGVLMEHLRLDGVSVGLGDDVWLRSSEASIKLGGSLNVTRVLDASTVSHSLFGVDSRGDSTRYKLALSGSLSADRGTYNLDFTAVQREFQVQSGRITFFGSPDFNPEIDVTALYQVKQANRADIGVRARIHGNFYPQPALELSSTDNYLSPSDLVSYLVTGRPSYELSRSTASGVQRVSELLLPTGSVILSQALRDQLGFVDLLQIQAGAVSDEFGLATTTTASRARSVLSSTRLGGEKQISDRLYLSFSTGLCQLVGTSDDAAQQGVSGFVNSIEGKLEYRFPMLTPDRLSLRAGREPAASALRCGADRVRGFVATPQQWGFSLLRSWSF